MFLSGGALALVRLASGLARSKGISAALGPEGIGLLAQATQFQLLATSAGSLSVTTGLIQGARGTYSDRAEDLFRAAIFLIACGGGAIILCSLVAGPQAIAAWLFGSGHGSLDFLLLLASLPFVLASSSFLEAAFFIHDRFDRYTVTSAIHAVLQSVLFVALAILFGLKGLLLAFPASAILLAAIFAWDLGRLGLLRWRWFLPRWNAGMASFLAGHGLAMLLTGVGGGFLLLFVRATLVSRAGLSENGILQVAIAFSSYGGSLVTNFIWGKIHPACSKAMGGKEEGDISFALFIAFLVSTVTWAVAPLSVPIVYSGAFLGAVPLVGLQSAGDVFYFAFFTLSVVGLARGGIKSYVLGWAAYYLPFSVPLFMKWDLTALLFVQLHGMASLLALATQLAVLMATGLLGKGSVMKAAVLTLPLGCLVAAGAFYGPERPLPRIACTALVIFAGYAIWYLAYRDVALATAKIFLSRIRGFWASVPRSHQ